MYRSVPWRVHVRISIMPITGHTQQHQIKSNQIRTWGLLIETTIMIACRTIIAQRHQQQAISSTYNIYVLQINASCVACCVTTQYFYMIYLCTEKC